MDMLLDIIKTAAPPVFIAMMILTGLASATSIWMSRSLIKAMAILEMETDTTVAITNRVQEIITEVKILDPQSCIHKDCDNCRMKGYNAEIKSLSSDLKVSTKKLKRTLRTTSTILYIISTWPGSMIFYIANKEPRSIIDKYNNTTLKLKRLMQVHLEGCAK